MIVNETVLTTPPTTTAATTTTRCPYPPPPAAAAAAVPTPAAARRPPPAAATDIAREFSERRFLKGATIIKQGEYDKDFFIIKTGKCVVKQSVDKSGDIVVNPFGGQARRDADEDKQVQVGRLKPGDSFGELALISDCPRAATVLAETDVEVYLLSRKVFESVFGKKSAAARIPKRMAVSSRAGDADTKEEKSGGGAGGGGAGGGGGDVEESLVPANPVRTKTPAQRATILKAFEDSQLFRGLSVEVKNEVMEEMWLKTVHRGVDIIVQGEVGRGKARRGEGRGKGRQGKAREGREKGRHGKGKRRQGTGRRELCCDCCLWGGTGRGGARSACVCRAAPREPCFSLYRRATNRAGNVQKKQIEQ